MPGSRTGSRGASPVGFETVGSEPIALSEITTLTSLTDSLLRDYDALVAHMFGDGGIDDARLWAALSPMLARPAQGRALPQLYAELRISTLNDRHRALKSRTRVD